jgi:hypothetical protein
MSQNFLLHNLFKGLDVYLPNSLLSDVDEKPLGAEMALLSAWSPSFSKKYEKGNNDFEQQALNNLFISSSVKYGSQNLLFSMFNIKSTRLSYVMHIAQTNNLSTTYSTIKLNVNLQL